MCIRDRSETSPGYGRFPEARKSCRYARRDAGTLARLFFARSDLRLPGFRGRTPGKARQTTPALFPTREASTYAGTPPAFSGIQAGRTPELGHCLRPPRGTEGSLKPGKPSTYRARCWNSGPAVFREIRPKTARVPWTDSWEGPSDDSRAIPYAGGFYLCRDTACIFRHPGRLNSRARTWSETSPGYGSFSEGRESLRHAGRGAGTRARPFFARSDIRFPGFPGRTPGKARRMTPGLVYAGCLHRCYGNQNVFYWVAMVTRSNSFLDPKGPPPKGSYRKKHLSYVGSLVA